MKLYLKPDTLSLLRLPLGFPTQRRHRRSWEPAFLRFLKHLVFFGLVVPLLIASGLLFLAALGD